ncbi:response regulator [Xanthovirga aplysinae]|uniref:response regulator n=1 Tax=Xanthovirga aplysinae TaxID=2529853 RepID=UPI0012BCD97D|nr:response regulator [Xanthovirga aplysinae]MTI30903.1 response regulator [Xanthovirga aplysinae]
MNNFTKSTPSSLQKVTLGKTMTSILLAGNNPSHLSVVYEMLRDFKRKEFTIYTAFTLEDSLKRVFQYQPQCILLDDTLGRKNIKSFIHKLQQHKLEKINKIPVILLKTSHKQEMPSSGIMDFLLKQGLTADKLGFTLLKVIKLKKTHNTFYRTYRLSRRKLRRFFRKF